ncbi:hypothetical protein KUL42_03060 [Alteromonas sp. KUL42]|uniref:response regulator n=1 Tax=Alteromonas sp. KUL42 TaxID=2480797 RepID=UPI0010358CD4|nr:response regulator [Alteromonas sp. KUL42]TAP38305.1 response regulator [Alteromonas sp. KUL42]GEA05545.1 hypothetical protein KUL42_03060 [Alteromonas sp. KUL42]
MSNYDVMVVDDSEISLATIAHALENVNPILFSSPLEALQYAENLESPPFLVILDLMMPEINGFEVCKRLRELFSDTETEIIFYSSNNNLDDRIKGFEVGASDFLVKPVAIQELQVKALKAIYRVREERKQKHASSKQDEAIKGIITELSEQSILVNFLRAANAASSVEKLCKLIVKAASDFGLSASVRSSFTIDDHEFSTVESTGGTLPPLELELLRRLSSSERIFTQNNRLFLNYPHFTLIVKNMPDDKAFAGRLRDHLAIMLEAVGSRIKLFSQEQEVKLLISSLQATQENAKLRNKITMKAIVDTMTDVINAVENKIFEYDLTETQEAELLAIFKESTDFTYEVIEENSNSQELEKVIAKLQQLLENDDDLPEEELNTVELF